MYEIVRPKQLIYWPNFVTRRSRHNFTSSDIHDYSIVLVSFGVPTEVILTYVSCGEMQAFVVYPRSPQVTTFK
jgi:hypothetical protein